MSAAEGFRLYAARCPNRVEPPLERRPANALNVEIGQPLPRCRLRTPEHWGEADPRAARWLLSGGSPLVLGLCSASGCPYKPDHCDCGHRAEHHERARGGCTVFGCGCHRAPAAAGDTIDITTRKTSCLVYGIT